MIGLGIFLLALAVVGVVCGIINIFYNPDEHECTDYLTDCRQDYRRDYRTGEPEGGRRD